MRQIFFILSVMMSLFSSLNSHASDRTREPSRPELTREIKSQNGIYTLDFEGITKLMKDLEKNDPLAFQRLKPTYDKIESDRRFYRYLGLGLAIGGAAAMFFSKQLAGDSPSNAATIGGGAALVGGVTTLFLLPPGQKSIEDFLNLYNHNSSGSGLKIGLAPAIDVKNGSLAGMIRLTIF